MTLTPHRIWLNQPGTKGREGVYETITKNEMAIFHPWPAEFDAFDSRAADGPYQLCAG
jgi:hypothetical protein